jgi:multidrug resistance efflux pump
MGLALLLLFVCPVRLSVLAPGELVPANPAVVRAPLEGVIDKFHVRPNERVQAGQPLFSFDETALASRLDVARQVLNTAQAEYRQMAQLALNDARSKGQLAVLLGRIGEKQAEVEFLSSQLSRSRVTAPLDGVAIFDDPAEWLGRPVQVGERVMKVAQAEEAEIEAWVPVGDAIPLLVGSPVNLYLAASPFSSVGGSLRYMAHDALPRPDGSYAYRIRASLRDSSSLRIGLKGTARLQGDWVPLGYWVLRRPLALVRQFLVW